MSKTKGHQPPALPRHPRMTWLVPLWVRRQRHLTVPLLGVPAGAMATAAVVLAAHWTTAVLIAGFATLVCVVVLGPHKWRTTIGHAYAVGTVLAAGLWLTAVAYRGLGETEWLAGAILAAAWGIPWWLTRRRHLYSSSARLVKSWNGWWQAHSHLWNGQGSGVVDIDPGRDVETIYVRAVAGVHVPAKLQDWLPHIESSLRGYIPHGMIRAHVDPADPTLFVIKLRRDNPLRGNIEWDSSQAPTTITEPAPIGQHGAGNWVKEKLTRNWFVIGMTQWGKSNELSAFLATITQCEDALPWLIDMKGGRATRPWLAALDWAAVTIDEARLLLRLALAESQARAEDADSTDQQLQPTPEVPAIFVIIDETHEVTSLTVGDTECALLLSRVASLGNGLAIYSIVLTQHGSLDESVRYAQTRANLANRLCFHVGSSRDGQFALEDWSKLDASRLDVPGTFYYQLGARASVDDAKGPHMPYSLVREISAANGQRPRQPLRLFCGDQPSTDEPGAPTWQEVYDRRWERLPLKFRKDAPQAAGLPEPVPAAATPPASAAAAPGQAAEAAALAAQIEADIAETPDVNPADLARIPSAFELETESMRKMAEFARLLRDADPDASPDDLVKGSGMSRAWIMAMLGDLVSDGAVAKGGRGRYRGVPGADVWAAIQAIRDRRSRMLTGASA